VSPSNWKLLPVLKQGSDSEGPIAKAKERDPAILGCFLQNQHQKDHLSLLLPRVVTKSTKFQKKTIDQLRPTDPLQLAFISLVSR
jgi:CRISPR/Cas system CMR-associated protein Cmr3 (group 5 of RAMP superfamily)